MTTYSKAVAICTANPQFNVVEKFYGLVPYETAGDIYTLSVNRVVRVPSLTFESLLRTMIDESANYDMFVIVDHGLQASLLDKTVTQLSMPLMPNRSRKTRQDICEKLLNYLNNASSAEEMAKYDKQIGLEAGTSEHLVDLMRVLRGRRVRWVNVRACAMGNNPSFMSTFGQCLSALFVNAPDVHMFYSQPIQPQKKAQQASFDAFAKLGGVRAFDDGEGQGLALLLTGSGPVRNFTGKTTATDLRWFMDQYFDKGHRYPRGTHYLPIHIAGMDILGPKRFALPTEPEYVQHIVWTPPLPNNMIGVKS